MSKLRLLAVALAAVALLACRKPRSSSVAPETALLMEENAWASAYEAKVSKGTNTADDDAQALEWLVRSKARAATRGAAVEARRPKDVTIDDYERISNGMTYAEVAKIIQIPGKQASRSAMGTDDVIMYMWTSKRTGGSLIATFVNGHMVNKSVVGLQ